MNGHIKGKVQDSEQNLHLHVLSFRTRENKFLPIWAVCLAEKEQKGKLNVRSTHPLFHGFENCSWKISPAVLYCNAVFIFLN